MDSDRERRRRLIRKIVDVYFDLDGIYDKCPPEERDRETRRQLDERVARFLLAEEDAADLKDEALFDMFERISALNPEPKEPTWDDVLFVAKVTGRDIGQVKESMERTSGKEIADDIREREKTGKGPAAPETT